MQPEVIKKCLEERDLVLAFFQSQLSNKQRRASNRKKSKDRSESLLEKVLELPAPELALLLAALKKGELG